MSNTTENFDKKKYPSRGKKWTNEEEKQLLEEISKNMDIGEIADKHGRTPIGITSRINHIAYKLHKDNAPIDYICYITKLTREEIKNVIIFEEKRDQTIDNDTPGEIDKNDYLMRGKKWTSEEDKQLLDEIRKDMTIGKISTVHGRTRGSILSRINNIVCKLHKDGVPLDYICCITKLPHGKIKNIICHEDKFAENDNNKDEVSAYNRDMENLNICKKIATVEQKLSNVLCLLMPDSVLCTTSVYVPQREETRLLYIYRKLVAIEHKIDGIYNHISGTPLF